MTQSTTETGDRFENVAFEVLTKLAPFLGLTSVEEGKQDLEAESGPPWQADLVAYNEAGLIKIECKYRANQRDRVKRSDVAVLAFSIQDTGAVGGIIVSCHPLQEGAQALADHQGIPHLIIDSSSNLIEYKAKIKEMIFAGFSEGAPSFDSMKKIVTDVKTGEQTESEF